MKRPPARQQPSWTDEFSVGGRQLAGVIERLLAKGNVRRLVILKPNGRVLLETTLTTGMALAGVFTVLAPVLTALAAMAALLAELRVRVIYSGNRPPR